jgi:hypothetical protein
MIQVSRLTAFLPLLAVLAAPLPAAGQMPAEAETVYLVKRDREPIGTLKMTVAKDGARHTVVSDYAIEVRLMSIVLYRYSKRMEETFEGGRLVGYAAKIDDNGKPSEVAAVRKGDALAVVHPKGTLTAPLGILASTYWPKDTPKQTQLLDSSDGILLNVKISGPEPEEIALDGRTVKALRYVMTGDLERELWYDAATGDWLRMRMKASDGSTVQILRDWPPYWTRGLL